MKIRSAIISLGYFAVLLSACNLDSYPQEKKATPQPEYSAPSPTTASRVLPTPEQLQHQRRFINAMSRGPAQAARSCTTNTAQEHDLVRNATPQSLVARKVACNPSLQIPPKEVKRQTPKLVSTGSGFVVSSRSQVLTNAHVVNDCDGVSVQTRDGRINAKHIARDISYDLALIDLPWPTDDIAVFRNGGGVRPGDQVVVVGFPLHGLLSREPNVTIGNVSALAGIGNDRTMLQITAPVQPGNSGGPLFDMNGHVIGIVIGKLNAIKMANAIGDLPQNVNFAINASLAQIFLDAEGTAYKTSTQNKPQSAADIAAMARKYTVLVECWR